MNDEVPAARSSRQYRIPGLINIIRKNARIGLRIFNKCQDRSESEVLLKIVTLSPPD
eukprot:COSAG02_NODE_31311_length_535_cov_9.582569_1_plen_56_part_10